ncbi:hypothetical protein JW796_00155 [Candidatus Dojkabacteria bacterium]|nr:hypothetical protein [Candidatus Dojkabacteria bacterium]
MDLGLEGQYREADTQQRNFGNVEDQEEFTIINPKDVLSFLEKSVGEILRGRKVTAVKEPVTGKIVNKFTPWIPVRIENVMRSSVGVTWEKNGAKEWGLTDSSIPNRSTFPPQYSMAGYFWYEFGTGEGLDGTGDFLPINSRL